MSVYKEEKPFSRRHLYLEHDAREIASYEWDDEARIFTIYDPVWKKCEIGHLPGDEVLIDLLHNDLVIRTMAIEQLSLDALTETIPATAEFARWEHIWGSVAFIRKMTEGLELGDRERLILQLRAFVSDLAHTAYSHLGDWIFQGFGGAENQHDMELMHLLETSGINEILRAYDIEPEEVIFPDVEDWIEQPAPDLCVDRVDYGAREILRWLNLSLGVWQAARPESFKMSESGDLVCVGEENALNFAKAFMLLPTEHWAEPVHRLQLYLKQELVKRVLTNETTGLIVSGMDPPDRFHPRDYIYTVDIDISSETWSRDKFLNLVRPLMQDAGLYRRRFYSWDRHGQLRHFLESGTADFPDPLQPYGWPMHQSVDVLPPNLEMLEAERAEEINDYKQNPSTYDVWLPKLKARSIDPLFEDQGGNVHRLSEVNPYFKNLLEQQRAVMDRGYLARMYMNPSAKADLATGIAENDARWQEALTRPRMDQDHFKHNLKWIAHMAITKSLVDLGDGMYKISL